MRELAVGGMGRVYLARGRSVAGFEKVVALKMIHPHLSANHEFAQLLAGEANLTGQLTHKNIAQVIDFAQVDGTFYIAMEYVDGMDLSRLRTMLRAKGTMALSPRLAAFVVREVCDALEYAHRKLGADGRPLRIVHRDVSPPNILISMAGEVKLTDFGVAKAASHMRETDVGSVKGKYGYMPPEQARSGPVDHRADVFAAGCVLYELASGVPVYPDGPIPVMVERVANATYERIDKVRPDLPAPLREVITRALQKDPAARFPTARSMGDALNAFLFTVPPNPEGELSRMLSDLQDSRRSSAPPMASMSLTDDESDEPTQIESMAVVREKMQRPTIPPANGGPRIAARLPATAAPASPSARAAAISNSPPPNPFADEPTRSVRMPDLRKSLAPQPTSATAPSKPTSVRPPAPSKPPPASAQDPEATETYRASDISKMAAAMGAPRPQSALRPQAPLASAPRLTPLAPASSPATQAVPEPHLKPLPPSHQTAHQPAQQPAQQPAPLSSHQASPALAATETRRVPSVPPSQEPNPILPAAPPPEPTGFPHPSQEEPASTSLPPLPSGELEIAPPSVGWFATSAQRALFIAAAAFAAFGMLTLLAVIVFAS